MVTMRRRSGREGGKKGGRKGNGEEGKHEEVIGGGSGVERRWGEEEQ